MTIQNQRIRVFPDNLSNLMIAVQKGQYRVPQFQREYVWEKAKVMHLFPGTYCQQYRLQSHLF